MTTSADLKCYSHSTYVPGIAKLTKVEKEAGVVQEVGKREDRSFLWFYFINHF